MLKVPRNNPAMYCSTELVGVGTPGCGPSGLGNEVRPLPLATRSCLPLGVTRTEVGYQPTGINPNERLLPGVLTSKTATRLLSALAMKSVCSSGEMARLLGVEPGGACGYREAEIVSTALPASVSKTLTVLRLALATKRYRPDRVRAISHGCSWVGHWSTIRPEPKSRTSTAAWAQRLT